MRGRERTGYRRSRSVKFNDLSLPQRARAHIEGKEWPWGGVLQRDLPEPASAVIVSCASAAFDSRILLSCRAIR